jgi:hypothetical protein
VDFQDGLEIALKLNENILAPAGHDVGSLGKL